IQWLSSAFDGRPPAPASLSSAGITVPIRFATFLDLPTLNSVRRSKRKTMLWKALKLTIIDELGRTPLPIPPQNTPVDACIRNIMGTPVLGDANRAIPGTIADGLIRNAINVALSPLPDRQLHISDFLPNTEPERVQLADTLWDAAARNIPLMLLQTNLV